MFKSHPGGPMLADAQPGLLGIQPRRGPLVDSRLNGILLRGADPAIRRSEHSLSSAEIARTFESSPFWSAEGLEQAVASRPFR